MILGSTLIYSDYGYMHSNGFTGSCVRDVAVTLTDPCSNNQTVSYKKSRGYRKVSGDICEGGVESTLGPVDTLCNPNTGTYKLYKLVVQCKMQI